METLNNLQQKNKAELLCLINELQHQLQARQDQIHQKDEKIQTLQHQLANALNARFGCKSERYIDTSIQPDLFDESEGPVDTKPIEKNDELLTVPSYQRKKQTGGRRPLPEDLPRTPVIHDLPESERVCSCGCALTCIGEEHSEQLQIVPMQVSVLRHIRKKYACKACELTVKTAKLPLQPIPKSVATSSLLAHIAVSKWDDHLPLYRLEEILKRHGIDICRMTLSLWMIRCGELVQPLINLLHDYINAYDIAYADETPVQVLKQKNKSPTKKNYMWLFQGGPPKQCCILYHYEPTRASSVPAAILDSFKGYLHCDGYSGYLPLFVTRPIVGVGCWAHVRRKFFEITKTVKEHGLAHEAVAQIAKLYAIESYLKDKKLDPLQWYEYRLEHAKPLLNEFYNWLGQNSRRVPPKSPIGQAIQYALNQWSYLINYLKDGRLEIDNNRSERGIKPFVIGRKNWLFLGNYKGAKAAANLYSIIETAKANGLNPFDYLKFIFEKLPHCQSVEDYEALMPFASSTVQQLMVS